jgi:hypothetical protein
VPADGDIRHRIFIVGAPRSGTTLVQSLLAAHSTVTSFTESHFFSRHFRSVPGTRSAILTRNPTPRVREFLAENGVSDAAAATWFENRNQWLRVRPLLPLWSRTAAQRLIAILDELARRDGRKGWIEKTPMHLHRLEFLESLQNPGPGARFVHVLRDGVEVIASLRLASQGWERPYDLDACIERWNADIARSLDRTGSASDHFVVYEQLTSDPETVLTDLLGWLGLAWEPAILDRYADASYRLVTGDEPWKEGVGRPIRPSATSDRALTAEERKRVRRSLRSDRYDELVAAIRRRSGGVPVAR